MNNIKSKKILIAILIVVLVGSAIGVIPSDRASADSFNADELSVGDILYPNDTINKGGLTDTRAIFALKIKDSFDVNKDITSNHDVVDSWISNGNTLPSLDDYNYDAWQVRYIKEYMTSGEYDSLYVILTPVKDIVFTNQPASVQIDKGNTATFSTSVERKLSPGAMVSYEWFAASETPIDEFNYTSRKNTYGNLGDDIILNVNKKSILSFNRSVTSDNPDTNDSGTGESRLWIYNEDLDEYVVDDYLDSTYSMKQQFILKPGKHSIGYEWDMANNYRFSVSNTKLTEITSVGTGKTFTVDVNSPFYKENSKFLCIVNNKEISNTATLTFNNSNDDKQNTAKLKKIHTPLKTLYVKKGKKVTLPVYAYKTDGTKEKLSFKSSKKKVATVGKNTGKVKAIKPGTATITVTSESGANYKIKIKVTKKSKTIKKLIMSGAPKSMKVGDAKYLSLKAKPAKATGVIAKWTSSNKNIISVDKAGRIEAKGLGKAKITAKVGKKKVSKVIIVN